MLDNNNQYNRPEDLEIQKISIKDLDIADKKCWLVALSAFLFPVLGLGLYLVWKDYKPVAARDAAKWGILGFIASVAFQMMLIMIYMFFIIMFGW